MHFLPIAFLNSTHTVLMRVSWSFRSSREEINRKNFRNICKKLHITQSNYRKYMFVFFFFHDWNSPPSDVPVFTDYRKWTKTASTLTNPWPLTAKEPISVIHNDPKCHSMSLEICPFNFPSSVRSTEVWKHHNFYPRNAMLARVIAIATCPSVCPSVRHARVLCQNEES